MAKLVQLVETIADSSGLARSTVNLVARHLREAGLISSGGRGPGGAEMQPRDASNLLIGAVAGLQVKDAPEVVRQFREAAPKSSATSSDHQKSELSIERFGQMNFGEMLDEMFACIMRDGDILDSVTKKPVDIRIEFSRTGHKYSVSPCFVIERDRNGRSIEDQYIYHRNHPDFDGLTSEETRAHARRLFKSGGVGLSILVVVHDHLIFSIADCLAGRVDDAGSPDQ